MKLITAFFTFIFILFSSIIFAQNWIPINEDDVYHYELVGDTMSYDSAYTGIGILNDNSDIDATIWIDSTTTIGETTHHFNKIVIACDTCEIPQYYGDTDMYLRRQPQFLLHSMKAENGGRYVLSDTIDMVLETQASLGDSWLFDTNIFANVTAMDEREVFGEQDSVKTIVLSNNDTILLSKTYGILRFPVLNDDSYYLLRGIQTRDIGVYIPDFKDIYNFDVGDIYQYFYGSGNRDGGNYGRTKITILDKMVFDDSITYQALRLNHHTNYSLSSYYYFETITSIDTNVNVINYTFYRDDYANQYPFQLFETSENSQPYWSTYLYDAAETDHAILRYGENADGDMVKWLYSSNADVTSGMNCVFNIDNFGMNNDSDLITHSACINDYVWTWEEGLGETSNYFSCYVSSQGRSLGGYIKDGDTTGTIISDSMMMYIDSLLLLPNEEVLEQIYDITLHPNPTTDQLHFNIQSPKAIRKLEVTVYDSMGKVLKINNLGIQSSGSLDVSQLPPGIYLISFRMEDGILSRRFIKG